MGTVFLLGATWLEKRQLELRWFSVAIANIIFLIIFAIELFQNYEENLTLHPWIKIVTHSLVLLMGIYLGVVLLFYAIPVAINIIIWLGNFIVAFFSFEWMEGFFRALSRDGGYLFYGLIMLGFSFILFMFTCTLFVGMPFVLTTLYVVLGLKTFKEFAQKYSKPTATTITTATIGIWMVLLFSFNQQPQVQAFNLLDKNPQNRQELLANSETIRKGLVNANLSAYRYLSTVEDNNHIYAMYKSLNFNDSVSVFLQQTYNKLFAPFLYQGSREDAKESVPLYAKLFDAPLQKAERKSVRHAIKSTSIIDEAKAGLLNIDQKKVWLEKQEVTVNPQGNWADVEIHEVYNNQTPDVEEIFYYFSLPESSSITGLWLGKSDQLDDRFAFVVSPRGAAQEVYNNQVRRTRPVDPALLEQVGVGQYRLRAFPVPPRLSSQNISNLEGQAKMHLWLTYKVMKQDQGWPLPKLAEKRNIFWTNKTKRVRNGQRQLFFSDVWLEDFWQDQQNGERQSHQINLGNGYGVDVKPLSNQDYALPNNQKYAVILDTSYSMGNHRQEVQETFAWWQKNLTGNDVDLYITDVEGKKAQLLDDINALDVEKQLFYGSLQTEDMLKQFQQLSRGSNYDAILLVTDEGSYELSDDKQKIGEVNAPLWMIHLGGEFPRAYNDTVLQAIQNSHGGVAENVVTVMKRLATEQKNGASVVDNYSWTVVQNTDEDAKVSNNSIEPITARQLVYYLSQNGENPLSLPELDGIHQVAKDYKIVTPYSSMIVLVNDQQREQLRIAEAKKDRFDREVEKGFEDLNKPFSPMEVSGVPEPDVWILLGIVILALLVIFQRQKKANIVD